MPFRARNLKNPEYPLRDPKWGAALDDQVSYTASRRVSRSFDFP
jgi:hypothetical protein